MSNPQILMVVPLLLTLAAATLIDLRHSLIPNVLSFGAALFALVLHFTLGGGSSLMLAAAGWLVGLAAFLPFYARGGMSAGDVKLMAAVGAFIGPGPGIAAALASLMAGAVIGLATILILRQRLSGAPASAGASALGLARKTRIPYAGAIAAGTSLVVLWPAVAPFGLMQWGALL